jgi:hypothetical protein
MVNWTTGSPSSSQSWANCLCFATCLTPIGRLDDLAQDIENLQLSGNVWQVIACTTRRQSSPAQRPDEPVDVRFRALPYRGRTLARLLETRTRALVEAVLQSLE